MKRGIMLIVAAIGADYYIRRGGPEVRAGTSAVTRGDIVDTVAATFVDVWDRKVAFVFQGFSLSRLVLGRRIAEDELRTLPQETLA
jgi:hypothetical protein